MLRSERNVRRNRRVRALVLFALAFLPPAVFVGQRSTETPFPLDVAVPFGASSARYTFHAGPNANGYIFKIEATASARDTRTGCLLRLDDPPYDSIPNPCTGVRDRLAFRWTLASGNATIAHGRYGDEVPYFQPSSGARVRSGEFAWPSRMPSGEYVLTLSGIHVPPELATSHPRFRVVLESDLSDLTPLFWFLGGALASVFFIVAAIVEGVRSLRSTRPKNA